MKGKNGSAATKSPKGKKTRTVKVDYLARVEGEGAMYVRINDAKVEDVKLKIFEPPRFFEAFLRGRDFREAPDITARICGICPIAYQMSSVHAMEEICGVKIEGPLRDLRRLIYCGEWIESHVLHAFMLHAPDFLGYESAIHMAKDHKDLVKMALRMKKAGNELMGFLGGREIHPINVKVGGFYRVPTRSELKPLRDEMEWTRDAALESLKIFSKLDIPQFKQDYEFVGMRHPKEYPFNEGRLVSNRGLDIPLSEFENVFEEEHVEHSTALHCRIKERGNYFVGPQARYNLNYDLLPDDVKSAAKEAGLGPISRNPFESILVRLVEILYSCVEAIRIMDAYEEPDAPAVEVEPRAGTGYGCSEAPRGICFHRYRVDSDGKIVDAWIVPPTSQNQKTIESDLWHFAQKYVDLPDKQLQWQCEQAIRNYDPCISCSVHFLNLTVDRT
ncbi:Ni/Fe hydrogenase subunit alpha [bacterium]|nr:Ni/Fe hydrogenase subunit alpha [bacterium]